MSESVVVTSGKSWFAAADPPICTGQVQPLNLAQTNVFGG